MPSHACRKRPTDSDEPTSVPSKSLQNRRISSISSLLLGSKPVWCLLELRHRDALRRPILESRQDLLSNASPSEQATSGVGAVQRKALGELAMLEYLQRCHCQVCGIEGVSE